jgi:hypothetical protein
MNHRGEIKLHNWAARLANSVFESMPDDRGFLLMFTEDSVIFSFDASNEIVPEALGSYSMKEFSILSSKLGPPNFSAVPPVNSLGF